MKKKCHLKEGGTFYDDFEKPKLAGLYKAGIKQ